MKPIVIVELATAAFFGIALTGQLSVQDKSKSILWLRLGLLSVMINLISDALAMTLTGPDYPFALRFTLNYLAYTLGSVDLLFFTLYCRAYISDRVKVKPWIFRIPLLAALVLVFAASFEFACGRLIVYKNEIAVAIHDIPLYLRLLSIFVMLYEPVVAILYRKNLGLKAVLLLGFYSCTPVIAMVVAIFSGADYSILFGGFALLLVATLLREDETKRLKNENAELERIRNEQIAGMTGGVAAYIVNPSTERFRIIVQNSHLAEQYPADEPFESSISRYIQTDVYRPDQVATAEKLSLASIVSALEREKDYSVRYRDVSSGNPRWYEFRAVYLSDEEILCGISDIEDKLIGRLLYDRLRENYFGLYYVNFETGLAQIMRTGHPKLTGEPGTVLPYSVLIGKIAEASEGEAAEFLRRISDISYLQRFFASDNLGYQIYKSHIFEGNRWVNATGLVLSRDEAGAPSAFALGFSLLDEDSVRKEEAQLALSETKEKLEAENHHNTVLNSIIKAGPWLFRYSAENDLIAAEYSPECIAVVRNDLGNGQDWTVLIHPEDRERVMSDFNACLHDPDCQTPYDAEFRIQSKDGAYRWIHSAGRMRRNADGTGELYGICTDINDTVRSREEQKKRMEDQLAIIGGLASEYTALYHVNLDTDDYVSYHLIEKTEDIIPFYAKYPKFVNLAHGFADSQLVQKEDRGNLYAFYPSAAEVKERLRDTKLLSMLFKRNYSGEYLWTEISIVKCEDIHEEAHNIIVGFMEKDSEVKERAALFRETEASERLIDNITSTSNIVYLVDLSDASMVVLRMDESMVESSTAFESFTEAADFTLKHVIHPRDRERMAREFDCAVIRKRLQETSGYRVEYRIIKNGCTLWGEMTITSLGESRIVLGMAEDDLEIARRRVEEKRFNEYFALFIVDLDMETIREIINESRYNTENMTGPEKYTERILEFADSLDNEEARSFFTQLSDPAYIREQLALEDKWTYSYRSDLTDSWTELTSYVIERHDDGTPAMFTLGFSSVDALATARQELQNRINESMEMIGGLAGEYTSLYHVNLNTGHYRNYHTDSRIDDTRQKLESFATFLELFRDFVDSDAVHPDYRQQLREFYLSDEALREALQGRKELTIQFLRNYNGEYLWTEMDIVKCEAEDAEAQSVVVGFAEKDEEIRERFRRFRETEDANRLIETVAAQYNLAYIVNLQDDSYELLRMDENILGYGEQFANFTDAMSYFFHTVLHPSDRERLMKELSYDIIRERLQFANTYNLFYRALLDGKTVWHELSITAIEENKIALGFAAKDLDIIKKHLEEKNYGEYFALFEVDLDTEMLKVVKNEREFDLIPEGSATPYRPYLLELASQLEEEPRAFFTRIADPSYMRSDLATDSKRTFSFKSSRVERNQWVDVTIYVTYRHDDGSPAMFTLGFSTVDALATARKELLSRLNEDMHMIGGLASEYYVLYYYNMADGTFQIYSLDEKKFPQAAHIVEAGINNPLMALRTYGMSQLVHPDDRALFSDISVESVREKLAHSKKYSIRFRRNFNGEYFWSEMEIIKYEDIDEEANAVAIGFAERDAEIRSEQARNICFRVLGQEIPPQEAIDKLLLTAGEFYGAARAYIFEYAHNSGVINNTYEWCAPGTDSMKERLQSIPFETVAGWNKEFKHQGAFLMDALDDERNTEETKTILSMQGIESLVAAPMMNGDEIVGFIGVDNPTKARKNIAILNTVAVVAYSEILQRKENDEEHTTLGKLTDAFLSVYYADLSNDYMRTWKISEEYRDAYASATNYSVSMGGYVREHIAERDRERCIEMTSPEYIQEQFRQRDRFSIDMTDVMLGFERNVVFDYIKVNDEGTQLVICCRDVTEALAKEKEQQRLLEEARNAAESASRSKTSFLFNMSHDIRTPMNAITGFTAMAKKYASNPEKVNDYLNKIDTSGQQLLALVNQVLEMARIESGKVELEETAVNIRDEFEASTTVLSEQAKVNGLEFHYSLSDISHYLVYADVARVSSITLNITGNAMKYTPRGGSIQYSLREIPARKPGCASYVFTVSDTGIGMSEDYLKELFEPFTREKSSTVSRIQGTGLGMSIVKQLVDLMGGSIQVESELGKGTRFDITIDFRLAEEAQAAQKAGADLRPVSFEGRRVLLVEDNDMNREIALELLEDKGLVVEDADDGTTAVEMLKENGPDYYECILMDIQMPVMGGYEATRLIREMYPDTHIPIIALSANAFAEDRAASLAAGMDGHVAKPIDVAELFGTMAKYM